jgi:hypothetical protein
MEEEKQTFICNHCGDVVEAYNFYYIAANYHWYEIDEKIYCFNCVDKIAEVSLKEKYNF